MPKIQFFFAAAVFSMLLCVPLVSQENNNYVEDEAIIWLQDEVDIKTLSEELESYGFTPKRKLSKYLNIWQLQYDKRGVNSNVHFNSIRSLVQVKYIQNNHFVELRSESFSSPVTPNDTHYSQQWGPDQIDLPEAWGEYSTGGTTALGDSIVIAVIDEGFHLGHEDLNYWENIHESDASNGIDNDRNGYVDDIEGWDATNSDGTPGTISPDLFHGSEVSGIIGAVGDNNQGIAGVH